MDDAILYLSDDSSLKAFELNWSKLEASTAHLHIDALTLCIRLLPSSSVVASGRSREELTRLLLRRLPGEPQDSEHLYKLAEICSTNEAFAWSVFHQIVVELDIAAAQLSVARKDSYDANEQAFAAEDYVRRAATFLTFLKCSFWLPHDTHHVVAPGSLKTLTAFIGLEDLNDVALDALSALLSLLSHRHQKPIVVANPRADIPWAKLESPSARFVLGQSIIDQSLWTYFKTLDPSYFSTKSSKLFKIWFQWISLAVADGLDVEAVYEDLYWDKVRTGLLTGFADQRKYCLGIVRASLLAAQRDINTKTIYMQVDKRNIYLKAYERYFILYETIVLDRYANQIEASLSELSALFGSQSVVTASMATTLLSSGLDPQVQEGVRKIIGNWYFGFMSGNQSPLSKDQESLAEHTSFLVGGFLPWATQGSLFTSTLKPTRTGTECGHGAALTNLVARFGVSKHSGGEYRAELLTKVLGFVLDAGGKMFQISILYLLEGLIKGYEEAARCDGPTQLSQQEIKTVLRISRTPGLPEIASDLYKIYCMRLCDFAAPDTNVSTIPGYSALNDKVKELSIPDDASNLRTTTTSEDSGVGSLSAFLETLQNTKHASIQGPAYATACSRLIGFFDKTEPASIISSELYAALYAMWEEADRREFNRSVAVHLPPLLFHPVSIQLCIQEHTDSLENSPGELQPFLTKALGTLQQLSEGRSYILASLATSLRKAAFSHPSIIGVLPYEDVILRFLNYPPAAKSEFLFEVAAADKLQQYLSHRSYASYYGQREWHAYAAWIDFLNRFPERQQDVAKGVFDRLLEPWAGQKGSVPVISKWKDVFQLQAMLVLTEHCVSEADADAYLDMFMHALTVEQWPRYRFVLEWIITRIYFHYPKKADRILKDLAHLDESSPIHIASLMKLAVLTAPFLDSEDFALNLITQLIPFSASQKVHIRHEAHLSFPMIFELAERKGWTSIISNPGFSVLNTHIRQTEKFKTPAWSIRTLRIDAVADFTITEIFQGQYLYIESPEPERVAHEDFVALHDEYSASLPPACISLGNPRPQTEIPVNPKPAEFVLDEDGVKSTFYQTKSGFDFNSLLPAAGPPHLQDIQPASVILVASLIDNPTNLGGLSRISESFGLETLYINDIKKAAHKDFKATSVTSEKHLPIKELKEVGVPEFLTSMKRKGYEVVGIEQTDRSGILGDDKAEGSKDVGTLPRCCVLVLGAEKSGITPEVLSVVDRCVEIRTVGVTRSLNVQTAGGIAVYEWWREWGGKAR
ncbi:tRNA (guanosine(18)-2'-O)-methyltransferase [Ascochyta rabiei]|uniref:RNA binding n=1 Tax=Didymella rabiei TaxID=5454 RepID=A0A163JR01_DIDRA|nr:tRNA (guanosine(18)-2'-O)-methyltransferase [Ascochyta rabiei]KZM26527.1 RNA binding [Ascochyta rabiei]UPX14981.1 tRNA (guanosine(18)-2'-O)-methyltransferase [Ascochyta rabiei]